MAYDTLLAARVEDILFELNPPRLENKKMFGGIGSMVQGNMACGLLDDFLIVRVGKEAYEESLHQPGVSEFHSRGRAMNGWVTVQSTVLDDAAVLREWVRKGVDFALTLPPK